MLDDMVHQKLSVEFSIKFKKQNTSVTIFSFVSFTYCRYPFPTQMIPTLGAGWRLVAGDIHKCTPRI